MKVRTFYVSFLDKSWDKIASILIGTIFTVCALLGVYACVSSVVEFQNYYHLQNRCQTVQGSYVAYEVDHVGRYGATKRWITVGDQKYQVHVNEVDENALKTYLKSGDAITLVIDSEEETVLAISDDQRIYLSYEASKNGLKENATSGIIMGVAFIAAGIIGAYFYFIHPHRRRKWRKR